MNIRIDIHPLTVKINRLVICGSSWCSSFVNNHTFGLTVAVIQRIAGIKIIIFYALLLKHLIKVSYTTIAILFSHIINRACLNDRRIICRCDRRKRNRHSCGHSHSSNYFPHFYSLSITISWLHQPTFDNFQSSNQGKSS